MKRRIVGEWQTDQQGKRYRRVREGKLTYSEYEMRIQTSRSGEITESYLEKMRQKGD